MFYLKSSQVDRLECFQYIYLLLDSYLQVASKPSIALDYHCLIKFSYIRS